MARSSYLNGCFWLFVPKFWEVVGTYKWYFSFYECRFSGGDTQTLPYAKEFVWTLYSPAAGIQNFRGEHLCLSHLVKLSLFLFRYIDWLYLFRRFEPSEIFFPKKMQRFHLANLQIHCFHCHQVHLHLKKTSFNTSQFVPKLYLKKTSSQVKHGI